jgi:DNA-directed RNA polymerase subunit RPC12/RpoP
MMTNQNPQSSLPNDYHPYRCTYCQRRFFAPSKFKEIACPLCQKGVLQGKDESSYEVKPEKILPFKLTKTHLQSIYSNFVSGVWIKPEDFRPENLLSRTIPLYWPLWLVDSVVNGQWEMEAGFDYQVESSKEAYVNGKWRSIKEIKERIRWEPRLGELETQVNNVPVPALKEHQNRIAMTGDYNEDLSESYDPDKGKNALLEVPDVSTREAWPMAKPLVDKTVEKVCQKACGAQHSRQFQLHAAYKNPNWTQFYLPMFATHYKDDENQPQILITNGQTGQIKGPRLASPKRGLKIAGIIAIIAGIFFALALLALLISLAFSDARVVATLLGLVGLGTGLIAIIPAVWPHFWNSGQKGPRIANRR